MKSKTYLLHLAEQMRSGVFPAEELNYRFGAKLDRVRGPVTVVAIVEESQDGGKTWLNVATFTLDSEAEVVMPDFVEIEGNALRASVVSVSGGSAQTTVWMEQK